MSAAAADATLAPEHRERVAAARAVVAALVTRGACPRGTDNLATLADGRVVSSSSEEWRAECLDRWRQVRKIRAELDPETRAIMLRNFGASRGPEWRRRLEAAVLVDWADARAAAMAASSPA